MFDERVRRFVCCDIANARSRCRRVQRASFTCYAYAYCESQISFESGRRARAFIFIYYLFISLFFAGISIAPFANDVTNVVAGGVSVQRFFWGGAASIYVYRTNAPLAAAHKHDTTTNYYGPHCRRQCQSMRQACAHRFLGLDDPVSVGRPGVHVSNRFVYAADSTSCNVHQQLCSLSRWPLLIRAAARRRKIVWVER